MNSAMTRLLLALTMLLCVFPTLAIGYTVDEIPNVHVQNKTKYVSNPDGILSAEAQTQADSIISRIWQTSSAEVVVVIVNNINTDDIDSFATSLFTKWGIGKKDNNNGLLLLIVKDLHKATIRTGYGMEGVVPDIIAGRIIRDDMFPFFRNENYDSGVLAALEKLSYIITTPGATEELKSKYENDAMASSSSDEIFNMYIFFACAITVGLLLWFIFVLLTSFKLDKFERYQKLATLKTPALFCTFLCLGMPLIVYIPLIIIMKRVREAPRKCPNCNNLMQKIDEEHDNDYLTPAQDMEERINSIDYDVWVCKECGEIDIFPFVNKQSSYTVCSNCGARTCTQKSNRVVLAATVTNEGRGIKEYVCCNCHKVTQVPYTIAKLAPPVVFIGGGRGRGFGGGISGGSFGGGMTGGGGATGRW